MSLTVARGLGRHVKPLVTVAIVIITPGSLGTRAGLAVSVVSVRHRLSPSPRTDFAWPRQKAASGERALADLESVLG